MKLSLDKVLNGTEQQCKDLTKLLDAAAASNNVAISANTCSSAVLEVLNMLDDIAVCRSTACSTSTSFISHLDRLAHRNAADDVNSGHGMYLHFVSFVIVVLTRMTQTLQHGFIALCLFDHVDREYLSEDTLQSVVTDALVTLHSRIRATTFNEMIESQNFNLEVDNQDVAVVNFGSYKHG